MVDVSLIGGSGLTGAFTPQIVHCSLPTLDGPELLAIGSPTDSKLSVRIMLVGEKVTVGVDTGAGSTYEERDFTASGITGFDPSRGGRIDSTLTPVPLPSGATLPNLPTLESISGTINCAGQTSGTSTIKVIGATADGAVSSLISPVNVSCTTGGVLIIGLIKVGQGTALIDLFASKDSFSFSTEAEPIAKHLHQYLGTAGSASATPIGAHIDGDAGERYLPTGAIPHTLHLVGDATCGANPTG